MTNVQIEEIWIYPVKSCRGTQLPDATLTARGFAGDREWLIVDERGQFLTQRTMPHLACIVPALSPTTLLLSAAGQPPLQLPRAAAALQGAIRRVGIWNDDVEAMDAGDTAAAWLRAALGVNARLMLATELTQRAPDVRWRGDIAAPVNFPDGFPLLICNRASLEDLNTRMPAAIPMTRFRPNIVISGIPAFAEDAVHSLHSGTVDLRLVKPCLRCTIPSVDQETGVPGSNPLPTLKTYRFNRELLGVMFGQNAIIAAGIGSTLRPGPAAVNSR